jgi:hypothetical protein
MEKIWLKERRLIKYREEEKEKKNLYKSQLSDRKMEGKVVETRKRKEEIMRNSKKKKKWRN